MGKSRKERQRNCVNFVTDFRVHEAEKRFEQVPTSINRGDEANVICLAIAFALSSKALLIAAKPGQQR